MADKCGETGPTADFPAIPDTSGLDQRQRERIEVLWQSSVPVLLTPNGVSCRPLIEGKPLVDADEVGAFASVGLSHDTPDLRYDLIYFADRQPTVETGEALVAQVKAVVADGSVVEFYTVASALFVVISHPGSSDDRRDQIIDAYDREIAGTE